MKELSIEEKAKAYDEALEMAKKLIENEETNVPVFYVNNIKDIFPELKESEDEMVRKSLLAYIKGDSKKLDTTKWIAWLERQSEQKPNYCHHEVDLSNCSEEYRKAYYDGWNNCNMQHSQCKSELNGVIKCLINGMKFYYEDNEEATWGTDKWSMPVKYIIEVLEKQDEQKPAWSEEDKRTTDNLISQLGNLFARKLIKEETKDKYVNWLKSLRPQNTWKPSDEQIKTLEKWLEDTRYKGDCRYVWPIFESLYNDLKKL